MSRLVKHLSPVTIATVVLFFSLGGAAAGRGLLVGSALLKDAHVARAHRYWWPAMDNCTFVSGTNRQGVWSNPYTTCTTAPAGYHNKPIPNGYMNPSDNVYAPPDTTLGSQPCDYEPIPCAG